MHSAAPYGFTLTIWSSGAALEHFRKPPAVGDVFLFAAGAVIAFTALWLLGRDAVRHEQPLPQGAPRVRAGVLDAFGVGIAVGAATLIAEIPSFAAWPLAAFTATVLYLLCASVQLAITEQAEDGQPTS
jgi:heme A synthase